MRTRPAVLRPALVALTVTSGLLAIALPGLPASAASSAPAARAASTADRGAVVHRDAKGRVHYLAPTRRTVTKNAATPSPTAAARRALRQYAPAFGVTNRTLRVEGSTALRRGRSAVRFQQTAAGLRVFGGQLAAVVDPSGSLVSVTGETSPRVLSSRYAVSAAQARARALRVTSRDQQLPRASLRAGSAARWLYDASIFDSAAAAGARASWIVTVTAPGRHDVRELVVVDGATGAVRLHVNQVERLNRVVCDNRNRRSDDQLCLRGRYVRTEASGPSAVADVNQAFDNVGATAAYYATFGIDLTALIGSNFGDGKKLRSTVRVCPSSGLCPEQNASWDGQQMVFGAGYATADDVVAHELTHGVTQETSGLVYYYQSGAINESMSDVFGELVDQTDGIGNDDPSVRWQLGEDLAAVGQPPARNMANPPAFQQPDQVNGVGWLTSADDDGEVHTNSGPGNKAAYLIADGTAAEPGGAFAGFAFPGLGVAATGALYWTAQNLLTPGADYSDLADALYTACLTIGVPQASCDVTVRGATAATRMQAPDLVSPTPPQALVVTGGDGAIRVQWQPPANWGTGLPESRSYVLIVTPSINGRNFLPLGLGPRDQVISGVPTGRSLTFGLASVTTHGTSPAAQVFLRGSRLALRGHNKVVAGRALTLRGRLTVVGTHAALPGRRLVLRERLAGHKRFTVVARTRTKAHGLYRFAVRPRGDARYVVSWAFGTRTVLGTHSKIKAVRVTRR